MDPGVIVACLTLAVTTVGGGVVWAARFGKIEAAAEIAREAKADAEKISADLALFKERVAREYATAAMVASVEGRIVMAIDRLGDRLDRVFEHRSGSPS